MSKQNSPKGKSKNAKADKAPAPAENETPKGEETPAGGESTAPENEAGEGEVVTPAEGENVGGFMDPQEGDVELANNADTLVVIAGIVGIPESVQDFDSSALLVVLEELKALNADDSFGEFQEQAQKAIDGSSMQVTEMYDAAMAAEAKATDDTQEETKDGFRPDCYEKIDKGITAKTKMIVVKLRYRLGDGTNMVVGDEFVAGQMDARVILGAMNSFHIVPVENKPLEGEHRQVFVDRMMKIYLPDVAPGTCDKKHA